MKIKMSPNKYNFKHIGSFCLAVTFALLQISCVDYSSKNSSEDSPSETTTTSESFADTEEKKYKILNAYNGVGVYKLTNSIWSQQAAKDILAEEVHKIAKYNPSIRGLAIQLLTVCEDTYGNRPEITSVISFSEADLNDIRKFRDGWYLKESLQWGIWMEYRYNPCVPASSSDYNFSVQQGSEESSQASQSMQGEEIENGIFQNETEKADTIEYGSNSSIDRINEDYPLSMIVNVDRSYFYDLQDEANRLNTYCVKGDIVNLEKKNDQWVLASFSKNGNTTKGWMKISDLNINYEELETEFGFIVANSEITQVLARPNATNDIIYKMKEGEVASYLGKKTQITSRVRIGSKTFDEPWYLIMLDNGEQGWVNGCCVNLTLNSNQSARD